jgi:hypothetical protein
MIRANIRVKLSDLDISFVEKLKSIFDNSNIVELDISDEVDETDYLLSTPANRESLFRSLAEANRKQYISKTLDELVS